MGSQLIPTEADRIATRLDNSGVSDQQLAEYLSEIPPYQLKDIFCDIVGVNHHTSKEDLMKLIAERI